MLYILIMMAAFSVGLVSLARFLLDRKMLDVLVTCIIIDVVMWIWI